MKMLMLIMVLTHALTASQTDRGIVTGRLHSSDGNAASGVRVAAVPVPDSNLPSTPVTALVLMSITQTDSSGSYRLENIPPGRYYITAGYVDAPMYFPGVMTSSAATIVAITAASPIVGIDFTLPHPLNLKVSGRLTGAPIPDSNPEMRMVTLFPMEPGPAFLSAQYNPDGSFEFLNVRPAKYLVSPFAVSAIAREMTIIDVADHDVTGVEIGMANTDTLTRQEGLELAWSLDGMWTGVAGDNQTGLIYASRQSGPGAEIDFTGKILRDVPGASGPILRLAHLTSTEENAFTAHSTWSDVVRARDFNGNVLWSYPPANSAASTGIDDAWPADLNGDGVDELVVGFNAGGGLHVVDSKGMLLWESTGLANVWSVSSGDVSGDGIVKVVASSNTGKVHVFNADGTGRRDLDPGFEANIVRVGKISQQDKAATILVVGTSNLKKNVAMLVALSGDGTRKWSLDLPSQTLGFANSIYLATGKPWLEVGLQSGEIYVVDAERGTIIATIDGQGLVAEAAWLNSKDGSAPLLVISTRSKLSAYRIKPN